jgi:hypothetical protein
MCRCRGIALPVSAEDRLFSVPRGEETEPALQDLCPDIEPAADEALRIAGMLGRIHERLVGRQVRRLRGGGLQIDRAAGRRKQNGVFYTPEYVTCYIVERTLGRQLPTADGRGETAPIRIFDPACGCGSFLVTACRHLSAWFSKIGVADGPIRIARCVHGMDIDREAVLIARRLVWLELIEAGADPADESLLDELAHNLRWGDVLSDDAGAELAETFDAVVGNPPYRRELNHRHLLARIARTKLGHRFRAPRMDLWYYFLHRGLECLRPSGRLSFIVSAYWTSGSGAEKLVRTLCDLAHIDEIFSLGRLKVFDAVSGQHMIVSLRKTTSPGPTTIKAIGRHRPGHARPYFVGQAPVTTFEKTTRQMFRSGRLDLEPPADKLLAKLSRWGPLGPLGTVRQGIVENPACVTGAAKQRHGGDWTVGEGVFVLKPEELKRLGFPKSELSLIREYHSLRDLGRYFLATRASLRLIYSTAHTCPEIDRFSATGSHLNRFRPIMDARRETRLGKRAWWQLHWPREEWLWHSPKIVSVQMAPRPAFVPALNPVYVPFSTNVFVPGNDMAEHLNYLAALLNSRLMWKWYRHHAKRRGAGLEINGHVLVQTPVRRIDFNRRADRRRHDLLVDLVEEMVAMRGAKAISVDDGRPSRRQTRESNQCSRVIQTERKIDGIVYELYELDDSDISTVEANTQLNDHA